MEDIKRLKKQNADLLLALQQVRNAALEEAALLCDQPSSLNLDHKELTFAIRSLKDDTPAVADAGELTDVWAEKGMTVNHIRIDGVVFLPGDWQLVMDEVARATLKFPTWPTDPLHAVAILGEEFGELTKAVLQTTYEPHKMHDGELRAEAIQTAAMALRFLASLACYKFAPCAQHKQSSGDRASAKDAGGKA